MAHIAVERRSVSMQKWSKLVFEQVDQRIFSEIHPLDNWQVRNGQYEPDAYVWEDDFHPIQDGDKWGGPDVTCMFQCDFTIPEELDGKKVYLYMYTATEVIITDNGRYVDGLDPNRSWCAFLDAAKAGEQHHMILECYTRSKPDDDRGTARNLKGCIQTFKRPCLVVIDEEMLGLKYDLDMLYQSAYANYMEEGAKVFYTSHVEKILKLFPFFETEDNEAFRQAAPAIREYIRTQVFEQSSRFGKNGKLACVAHSHLDLAYHWTMGQTIQKNARTVLIQLRLMDRYPEFKYSHTQAWVYEMLQKYYPPLFEEVKQRVAEGRWEIVGAMYVEPDCNLVSAESLARQIMYGKSYFLKEFGVDVDIAWLPDVFGNSPIMPQILKQGGVNYFVSNKMSTWNDTNLFPHNNFLWRGLDGTTVNACVPPVHFNSWMDPNQLIGSWEAFQDKSYCDESLQMFGYGDGGSGITNEMMEYYYREQQMGGIPQMRLTTGKDYLHTVFTDTTEFPVWDGDLYLEMHRGTFTTKGELKRYNRKGEYLAQQTEATAAIAALLTDQIVVPQEDLSIPWKKLLFNQFHDILPGSHTAPVGIDAIRTYKEMNAEFYDLNAKALNAMTEQESNSFVAVNAFSDTQTVSFFDKPVNVPSIVDKDNRVYPVQKQLTAEGAERYCTELELNGFSLGEYKASDAIMEKPAELQVSLSCLENAFVSVHFDKAGNIVQMIDKVHNQQVGAPGALLNQWQMFEDCPGIYNAWDIVKTYKNHQINFDGWTNISIVEEGPISVALRMEKSFSKSQAVQIVRLYANSPRVDFETWMDWHEKEKLLKVAFPVNVKARVYSTDTSAGVLERMNNKNTTWEQARFEVPCHKWVDLSEGMFGVSILNDCKYGCDVEDNVIRLSLLKAPIRPDRESDLGTHYFTYSIYPHGPSGIADGLVESAYQLNLPATVYSGRKLVIKEGTLLKSSAPALKVQAFKLAEDGSKDVIIRFAELHGSHGTARITLPFLIGSATECDLMEKAGNPVPFDYDTIELSYAPNQIISVRLQRK
ncbi:alpha-mannosidase [Paenibacillus puldeungensis]|uniref:Alpha-mannosidase n=1 Tax=Paenibacillus puldeungensis TaxID=696536 RepID=A0ABW3RYP9_9BACL